MKPPIAPVIALCLIVIAGAVVWQRMHGNEFPDADLAVETPSGKSSHREKSQPAHGKAVEPDPMAGQRLKTVSQSFGRTSQQLVTEYELSAAQAGRLKDVFARREKQLEALLAANDPDAFRKICDLIRNKGLREDLVGVLSPQQLAAYDEEERKRQSENAEARAYRDMAEVSSVVRLTDDQKQAALGALIRNAPEKLEMEADARAIMSLFYDPMVSGMNPADIRSVANLMNIDASGTPDFDFGSTEHLQRIEQQKAERIDGAITALQGILDEGQLARYREHLEKQPVW